MNKYTFLCGYPVLLPAQLLQKGLKVNEKEKMVLCRASWSMFIDPNLWDQTFCTENCVWVEKDLKGHPKIPRVVAASSLAVSKTRATFGKLFQGAKTHTWMDAFNSFHSSSLKLKITCAFFPPLKPRFATGDILQ